MNPRPPAQRGSAILVALCFTIVLGAAVTGFVALCARTMEISNRSFCYINSTQLAEIGLEEALWSLNQACSNASFAWPGWTLTTVGGVPTATIQLTGYTANKGITGVVNLQITNYNPQNYIGSDPTTYPVITSDGVSQLPGAISIDRQLKVRVKQAALFNNAVASVGNYNTGYYVYFASGGSVDSYDSSQGAYTPSPSTTNRSDQAIVSGSYVWVYNASILGYAASANSGYYLPYFNSSASVKGLTSPGSPLVDQSRISNNANQPGYDISFPSPQPAGSTVTDFSGLAALNPLGTVGSTTPTYYYVTGDLAMTGSRTLNIVGPVVINVYGNFSIQDPSQIVVSNNGTPTNYTDDGSLQLLVAGNININGAGIINQTLRPKNLAIFGTVGATYPYQVIDPTADFCGVIYVPNAILEVDNAATFYGALVGRYVLLLGAATVHYDVSLRKASFSLINEPYDVNAWLSN